MLQEAGRKAAGGLRILFAQFYKGSALEPSQKDSTDLHVGRILSLCSILSYFCILNFIYSIYRVCYHLCLNTAVFYD